MTRSIGALVMIVALASCVTEPAEETAGSEQSATVGHFPNAKMIAQPAWDGSKPPAPGPKQGYVIWADAQGYWNALLADTGAGKIVYAVKVDQGKIGSFVAHVGSYGRYDGGRFPPPVGPTGGDWVARYALELQLDVDGAHARAMALSF